MQVLAPAKINLSLRILGRRGDGFHEIETVIAPISLCDELKIDNKKQGIEFRCDDPSVPQGGDNLVVRAANAFFASTKLKPAISIELRKKVPHGAGLGGGSSDAAATLLALNQLFQTKLTREGLAKLGSTIGSDVPFFIFESAAICRGRGELVEPVKLQKQLPILLAKPEFGVASEWAYSLWQDSRKIPGVSYEVQEFAGQTVVNDLERPGISYVQQDLGGQKLHNELERPVFEKFVFLAQLKMWLLEQPEVGAALMSGSGSTIFAAMRQNVDVDLVAKRACEELDRELRTCACETLEGVAPSAP